VRPDKVMVDRAKIDRFQGFVISILCKVWMSIAVGILKLVRFWLQPEQNSVLDAGECHLVAWHDTLRVFDPVTSSVLSFQTIFADLRADEYRLKLDRLPACRFHKSARLGPVLAPELGWSPEAKQMIASWVQQFGGTKSPAGSDKQAAPVAQSAVAPKAPAAPSLDPEQVNGI
jgi:hypothetical protein